MPEALTGSETRSEQEIIALVVFYNNEAAQGKITLDDLAKHQTGLAKELLNAGNPEKALQISMVGAETLLVSSRQRVLSQETRNAQHLDDSGRKFQRAAESFQESTVRMGRTQR